MLRIPCFSSLKAVFSDFYPLNSRNIHLFYQVQSMLAKNVNRRGNRTAEKVQNVFRNLCRCSVCGGAVKVYKDRYLGCSGYRTSRQDKNGKPCTVKNLVPFAEMEREFISWFVPQAKEALLGNDDSFPRIDALEARQKALASRIETTLGLLDDIDNPLPVEQIKSRLTKLAPSGIIVGRFEAARQSPQGDRKS